MATLYDADGNAYEVDDSLFEPPPEQQHQTNDGPKSNSDFAALRKQTQATKVAEKAASDAKREAAFLRAGIDPDSKEGIASYFVKGYEGDLTADAIKAAATAAGVLQAPALTPEQVLQQSANQDALAAAQRASAAAGAQMSAPTDDMVVRQAMDDAYKAGGIEALTAVLQSMGIPRVTL